MVGFPNLVADQSPLQGVVALSWSHSQASHDLIIATAFISAVCRSYCGCLHTVHLSDKIG